MTRSERADIFFMALTGMTTDELAKKIVKDYNDEIRMGKGEIESINAQRDIA